jgi:hypothetical protein
MQAKLEGHPVVDVARKLLGHDKGVRSSAIIALCKLNDLWWQLEILEYVRNVDPELAQEILNISPLHDGCARYARILRASTMDEAIAALYEGPEKLNEHAAFILGILPAKITAEILKALPGIMRESLIENNSGLRLAEMWGLSPEEAAKILSQMHNLNELFQIHNPGEYIPLMRHFLEMSPRWFADVVVHMPVFMAKNFFAADLMFPIRAYEDFSTAVAERHPKYGIKFAAGNVIEAETLWQSGDILGCRKKSASFPIGGIGRRCHCLPDCRCG